MVNVFVRQDAGEGVMQFRHGAEFARWDQSWNQRVHLGVLSLITHDDFAQ